MSEDSPRRWSKRQPERIAADRLDPEKVPDWDKMPYPDLDTVKKYRSHPKPYTWPQYDPIHTFDRDYRYIRPDIYLEPRSLFRPVDGGRPWRGHVQQAATPLGPRRIDISHLGSAIKHLPRVIPPDAPLIAGWSNDYHDAPDAHGVVIHCHWCDRPFISLGLVMNSLTRKKPLREPDIDGRHRHRFCNQECVVLYSAYVSHWARRFSTPVSINRDNYVKRNYPLRRQRGRTGHKFNLNQKYKVRWDFLHRYVSTEGTPLPMNDIVPRGQKTPPVTKVQRNKLRQQIYRDTEDMVRMAKAVLAGDHQWNSSQVQVFKSLMNKVLPDAHVAEEHTEEAKSLENLSTEDLERLIAETEGTTPAVIDNEPNEPSIKVITPSEEDDPLSVV